MFSSQRAMPKSIAAIQAETNQVNLQLQNIQDDLIKQLDSLNQGWDGYNADPPSQTAISQARLFFSLSKRKEAKIKPSVVGGIGITFKNNNKKCYVEFGNCGSVCVMFTEPEKEPCIFSINISVKDFKNLINDIDEFLTGNI